MVFVNTKGNTYISNFGDKFEGIKYPDSGAFDMCYNLRRATKKEMEKYFGNKRRSRKP